VCVCVNNLPEVITWKYIGWKSKSISWAWVECPIHYIIIVKRNDLATWKTAFVRNCLAFGIRRSPTGRWACCRGCWRRLRNQTKYWCPSYLLSSSVFFLASCSRFLSKIIIMIAIETFVSFIVTEQSAESWVPAVASWTASVKCWWSVWKGTFLSSV